MAPVTVHIALGSNLGDRTGHLETALQRLAQVPGIELVRRSAWRESALQGDGPPQGTFCNGVAELRTTAPTAMVARCCIARCGAASQT